MEESLLDYAASKTSELMETLMKNSAEEHDKLILEHIIEMSSQSSVTTILDPNEKCEWVYGPGDQNLASYCIGNVALMDFFTYCCINCQHILPDLNDLEKLYSLKDGFAVVGVHSAKFDAERLSSNILHAIQRLNIHHPVLNDPEAQLWNRIGVHCWPTLVLLSPEGKPILVLAGEGHRDILFRAVSLALTYYRKNNMLKIDGNKITIPSTKDSYDPATLKFPGKVIVNPYSSGAPDEPWLTISDSGNNRIILADSLYKIIHIIGGLDAELKDGEFQEAKFNNPQGVCWLNKNILVVCDTGNHVLRRIDITLKTVEMLAGTGVQAEFGDQGGLKYCQQSLASPWDIVLYKTADMDMSIRKLVVLPDVKTAAEIEPDSLRRVLLVACAGSHQIWAVFLDTTVWWKYKTYAEGSVLSIVGNGREENRNNRYPNSASLAQPSGLALYEDAAYIADSESSSIRHLDLKTGQLSPLAGADRNPSNLFAYGDVDGRGYSAKLQHPLGVSFCSHSSKLFVADTYNHKIKIIEPTNGECTTYYPKSETDIKLSEPGGLFVLPEKKGLIIADTNNHRLIYIDQNTNEAKVIQLKFPETEVPTKEKTGEYKKKNILICPEKLKISPDGKIILNLDCRTNKGDKELHLTPEAPQRWNVKIFDEDMEVDKIHEWELTGGMRNGKEIPGRFEACRKVSYIGVDDSKSIIRIEFFLSFCEGGLCFLKNFSVNCELITSKEAKNIQKYDMIIKVSSEGDMKVSCQEISLS